ncbi:MerR family transcriptional regulator [Clostridium sp. AN503]|uniref:MerR family transcriptional regulator n=1 Tax=Clostridium sp. AN503 TaxID=3160598 RepID=UPI00345A71D8
MKTYRTSEIAAITGIHPNTVRLYEELNLIPKVKRKPNGYRVFTDYHVEQIRLARLAFQIEVLQNGLRKKIVQMVKRSAAGDFDGAILLTGEYLAQVRQERANAEEAIRLAEEILHGEAGGNEHFLKRKEVSEYLGISMDTLRNWEMNGLLTVKRKQNGYRVYTDDDIRRLKIIRSLRCANYSLEAILRMLSRLCEDPDADIREALDTPKQDEDIIAVCDRLITSLSGAEENAEALLGKLNNMKQEFS